MREMLFITYSIHNSELEKIRHDYNIKCEELTKRDNNYTTQIISKATHKYLEEKKMFIIDNTIVDIISNIYDNPLSLQKDIKDFKTQLISLDNSYKSKISQLNGIYNELTDNNFTILKQKINEG